MNMKQSMMKKKERNWSHVRSAVENPAHCVLKLMLSMTPTVHLDESDTHLTVLMMSGLLTTFGALHKRWVVEYAKVKEVN